MQSLLDTAIREQLTHYLAGEQTLAALEDWFHFHTWNVYQRGDVRAAELRAAIELCLTVYSDGEWTEAELRDQLRQLL